MTTKDFEAIAKIIKHTLGTSHLLHPLVQTMSRYFEDEYPRFDKNKFKTAIYNGIKEDSPITKDTTDNKVILPKTGQYGANIEYGSANEVLKGCDEATKNLSKIITESMNR